MKLKKPFEGLLEMYFLKAVDGFEPTIKLLQSRAYHLAIPPQLLLFYRKYLLSSRVFHSYEKC